MALDASLLSQEIIRFGTFQGWPGQEANGKMKISKPSVIDLAKAGFYYTGQGDEVRCYVCGLTARDWERHHDPVVVHATRRPSCPFVTYDNTDNAPVFVPPEREYATILSMLREAGLRVASTVSGSSYASSTLVTDTLKSMYGESMMNNGSRLSQPGPSVRRSQSTSPRTYHHDSVSSQSDREQRPVPSEQRGTRAPRATGSTPPRRSSTSDSNDVSAHSDRPRIQRAQSYAADPRSSKSSETIANRQNSSSGSDNRIFQESEDARFQTFSGWSGIREITAREFAQAGFIYIGPPDRVQCVFCSGILRNWNDNDLPIEEHRKHFPNCRFVTESLAAITVARPRHMNYRAEPSRLASFRGWDLRKNPKPAELAKAGFFFVGHGDSVKCFFCDGGLRNWEPNDDPWREHARWFPSCPYVKQSKGQPFIDSVLNDTNLTEYQTASVDETELKNVARAQVREVDQREVTARMDSAIVKTVLNMDVPPKLVKKALKQRLAKSGEDFSSAEALLEAVFNLGDQRESHSENDILVPEAEVTRGGDVAAASMSSSDESPDSIRLAEENRQLKEQRQCKICMDEEVCVAFLPCGHLVCCSTCAPALNQCPICRAKIRGTVRTYMS